MMIDGYTYHTHTAADGKTTLVIAKDGNEYKTICDHDELAGKSAILRMPGAATALLKRQPDKISVAAADLVCVEWKITCSLTGAWSVTICAPLSKRADRVDQMRIEFERRDAERVAEIKKLRAEVDKLLSATIDKRILDYFDAEIYGKFIHGGGASPEFMKDSKHWFRHKLMDGYDLAKPHFAIEMRFSQHVIAQYMPLHSPIPSAFEYMIARMGPGIDGGIDRIQSFLIFILPYINMPHIIQTCEWLERITAGNSAAVAKILREHIAAGQGSSK